MTLMMTAQLSKFLYVGVRCACFPLTSMHIFEPASSGRQILVTTLHDSALMLEEVDFDLVKV